MVMDRSGSSTRRFVTSPSGPCHSTQISHGCELRAIAPDIIDVVRDDEVMLRVDCDLDIVTNHIGPLAVARHGARIGIGKRYLPTRTCLQPGAHRLKVFDPLTQALDLVFQPRRLFFGDLAALAIGPLQGCQITGDIDLGLLDALGHLVDREVVVAAVHRFELAAIERHDRF